MLDVSSPPFLSMSFFGKRFNVVEAGWQIFTLSGGVVWGNRGSVVHRPVQRVASVIGACCAGCCSLVRRLLVFSAVVAS